MASLPVLIFKITEFILYLYDSCEEAGPYLGTQLGPLTRGLLAVACRKGYQGIQSIPKVLSSSLLRSLRSHVSISESVYPDIFATDRHCPLVKWIT